MIRNAMKLAVAIALLAGPAWGRELLGAWSGWAAFRDRAPARCYAIARAGGGSAGFVTVARFPGRGRAVRVHLSRPSRPGAPVRLSIGDRWTGLSADGAEARAATPRAEAGIVAAMRGAETMRIEGIGEDGRSFRDVYQLAGAASAIDAATLACR